MAKEYINPSALVPPPGGIFTHVVKVGDTVYITGQVGRDAQGTVVPGDAGAQYRQVMSNIRAAIEAAGGTLQDIVKTTTYVVGTENIPAVRAVREELRLANPATSTMVVVAALAAPAYLVEVEAIGHLGT